MQAQVLPLSAQVQERAQVPQVEVQALAQPAQVQEPAAVQVEVQVQEVAPQVEVQAQVPYCLPLTHRPPPQLP